MRQRLSQWLQRPATVLAAVSVLAFAALPASAQLAGLSNNGKIHGHVTNPTGAPQTNGTVSLSQDGGKTSKYTFQVDANGDYKGDDVAPGSYTVVFRQPDTPPDKMVDSFENVKIATGQDVVQDIDMSRQAFIDKLPDEQRKKLEELKKQNAGALKANEVIKQLNADIKVVMADLKDAGDTKDKDVKNQKYADAETLMKKDTEAKPDASVLWAYLGQAQVGLGLSDKAKYDEAIPNLKKAIDLESTSKKPNPAVQGLAESELGEAYARTGKVAEANAAYAEAAKANPPSAAMYLRNQAVIFFQTNNADAQVAAANEALKVDPNQAVLYYIIGQGLVTKATMGPDPKNPKQQIIILPPGCAEAYQKYLDLAPDGPYSADARGILQQAGQKVSTTYKAGKKS